MNVLGIETSCDETAAAVVSDGKAVLSNVVFSQIELHAPHGGVVPEIASRSHVESLPTVIDNALTEAKLCWDDIDAIAATYGPGLSSSLLVGFSAAKGLSLRLQKPIIAVNHLEAHLYSVFLGEGTSDMADRCPFMALIVSGGHTCLVRVDGIGAYELLGRTIDDAAGEAFDKGATLLGLQYPGGPAIDAVAKDGANDAVSFPRGGRLSNESVTGGLPYELCFSFSGLKTALLYYLRDLKKAGEEVDVPSVAASYQEAIVGALIAKCRLAVNGQSTLVVCGGVSLNSRLRDCVKELTDELSVDLLLAEPKYCGDNAAMIAGLAGAGGGFTLGRKDMALDINPNLGIGK